MPRSEEGLQAEQSLLKYLAGDAEPAHKAHFCLSCGADMEKCGDYESAVACYSLAFGLTPQNNDIWYFIHNNLGYSLNQLQRYQDAELCCRQAIHMNSDRHNAFKNLGVALEGLGRYVEAAHQYAHAAVLQPMDSRAYNHLVKLMDAHSDLPEGITSLKVQLLDLYHLQGIYRITPAEGKATAAVYAQLSGVLQHVRTNGLLPEAIDDVHAPGILRKLVEDRGADIDLTADEQLVYNAMCKEGRMRGGIAQLSDPAKPMWRFL